MRATRSGSTSPEAVAEHEAGGGVERRGLAVEHGQQGPVAQRDLGERRRRVDAERRADGEEHVGTSPPPAAPARGRRPRGSRRRRSWPTSASRRTRGRRDRRRRRARGRGSPPSGRATRTTGTSPSCTVPWISMTISGDVPAAWCRPSTFWVTSVCRLALRSSSASARCPALGSPRNMSPRGAVAPHGAPVLGVGDVVLRCWPCARPSGPWSRRPAGRGSRGCPTRWRCPRR